MKRGTWGIIGLIIIGVIGVYLAWRNFTDFHNAVIRHFAWDWNFFFGMALGLIVVGFTIGTGFTIYTLYKTEKEDRLKAAERQKLKEEIKRELEMERQKKR